MFLKSISSDHFFNLNKYEEAIPYLKAYKGKNKKWNNISLVGVLTNSNYETESDLYKFASNRILKDTDGPIFTRSAQYRPNNSLDNLNSVDLTNIINGRQPLIQTSFKITNNDQNLEFLNVVANPVLQLPTIPGDYLTDPSNPLNYNPRNSLQVGTLINDAVGAIASMIGIRGKPKISPRPSDILIQYMGEGQKSILFDLLSYSRYAPNYTILSTVNNFIQNQLQINLPIQVPGNVYIAVTATENPAGYFYLPTNGHFYRPISTTATYTNAKSAAASTSFKYMI